MWTMTVDGFLSAVQHNDDPDLLVVRGRVKADVRTLATFYATGWHLATDDDDLIVSYPLSDYPWRVIVPKDVYAGFLYAQAMAVDYGNFKTAVAVVSPSHARVYHDVWTDLLPLEADDAERDLTHENPYAWAGRKFMGLADLDGWDDDLDREDTYAHASSDSEQPEANDDWMTPAFQGWVPPVRHDDLTDDSSTRYGDPF